MSDAVNDAITKIQREGLEKELSKVCAERHNLRVALKNILAVPSGYFHATMSKEARERHAALTTIHKIAIKALEDK